jgi:hypothetical protein
MTGDDKLETFRQERNGEAQPRFLRRKWARSFRKPASHRYEFC